MPKYSRNGLKLQFIIEVGTRDSDLQPLRDTVLNRTRIPVPPHAHYLYNIQSAYLRITTVHIYQFRHMPIFFWDILHDSKIETSTQKIQIEKRSDKSKRFTLIENPANYSQATHAQIT